MVRSTRSFIYKFPNMDGHLPELISSSRKSREVPRWGGGEGARKKEKNGKESERAERRREWEGKGRSKTRERKGSERERDGRSRDKVERQKGKRGQKNK